MKAGTKISKDWFYFDGSKWIKVPNWMVGAYVSKRATFRFRRRPPKIKVSRKPATNKRKPKPCPYCNGSGWDTINCAAGNRLCTRCQGTGKASAVR